MKNEKEIAKDYEDWQGGLVLSSSHETHLLRRMGRSFTGFHIALPSHDEVHFSDLVSRKEQNGEEYVSSFIYVEAWRKNDSTSFELLKKGKNITVKGFFKPDEWTDQQGVKHNRIIMAVTDFYEPVEKEEEKAPVASKKKKAKKAA